MKKLILVGALLAACGLNGAALPVTNYTVIAEVVVHEKYIAYRQLPRVSLEAPYGNEATIVAKILAPESLAGREIAIPYESAKEETDLLVKQGTIFRFEYHQNLIALRNKTGGLSRTVIEFPRRGIIVLDASGEVAAALPGPSTGKL